MGGGWEKLHKYALFAIDAGLYIFLTTKFFLKQFSTYQESFQGIIEAIHKNNIENVSPDITVLLTSPTPLA